MRRRRPLLAASLSALAIVAVVGCRDAKTTSTTAPAATPAAASTPATSTTTADRPTGAERKGIARAELSRLVMGKKPDDLYPLIGRPNRSTTGPDPRFPDNPYTYTFLHYPDLSIDPYTGKPEAVRLKLSGGASNQVIDVVFGD